MARRPLLGWSPRSLAALASAVAATATACGGSEAQKRSLADLLPENLAGVQLERQVFTGPAWLRARPESSSAYSPERLRVEPRLLLGRLHRTPRDLTAAWALAPEGIQVIAYRVRGVSTRDLRNAYLSALRSHGGGRRMINVAGRRVTLLPGLPQRGFVYVHNDVAYSANSFHVDGSELEELIGKLPGHGTPTPPLQRLLPAELAGVDLHRRTFTGRQWLEASPERSFQPEVAVGLQELLAAAGAPPSGLTAAWAFGPDGPKVVAYRIIGVDGRTLLRSFLRTVDGVNTRRTRINGKQVVVAQTGVPERRGYLYVDRETLFVAGSNHLDAREVRELFARLP